MIKNISLKTLFLIISMLYIFMIISSFIYIISSKDMQDTLNKNFCYTEEVEVQCVNIEKSFSGENYQMTYVYKIPGTENNITITRLEDDVTPDLKRAFVSPNDPQMISDVQTDTSQMLMYVVQQPTFGVYFGLITLIAFVLIIAAVFWKLHDTLN